MKKYGIYLLVAALCIAMTGCRGSQTADPQNSSVQDLQNVPATVGGESVPKAITEDISIPMADFALELLRQSGAQTPGSILISPLSALSALTMAANGARGETLRQMEVTMGMPLAVLNPWLSGFMAKMDGQTDDVMEMANAIWVNDTDQFTVNPQFLARNAELFGAETRTIAFNAQAVQTINDWVKEKTQGMIPEILEEIPEDVVMYLINALAFRGQWNEAYEKSQVRTEPFMLENGEKQDAELMYHTENRYILAEDVCGFIKPYAGGEYAFVALLPKEGTDVETYLQSLTGEKLLALVESAQTTQVLTALPKFTTTCTMELSQTLRAMGMHDAFDKEKADFSAMDMGANRVLYISRVLHKTYIQTDEQGTQASAATAVEMKLECAVDVETKIPEVILNRPFVYLILDTKTSFPVFMGTMMDVAG